MGVPYFSQKDYHQIHIKAIEKNIPHKTLIFSLVYKYANGTLIQKSIF